MAIVARAAMAIASAPGGGNVGTRQSWAQGVCWGRCSTLYRPYLVAHFTGEPMSVTIAPERPDQPDIVQLLAELDAYQSALYPPESNHLLSVAELLDPGIHFLVARRAGVATGCGALRVASGYAEIKRMYVRPDQRGAGLGRAILDALCLAAVARGVGLVRLETGIAQPEAIRLYERAGFYRIGPFGAYRDDPLSLFYERRLEL